MAPPKFRFGKNAVLEIAAAPVGGARPALSDAAWKVLCLANQVKIKRDNGTETLNNFCTNGQDVTVRDGSNVGTMDLGDTTWVEDDAALIAMQAACFASDENGALVYANVWPLGKGLSKPYFQLALNVKSWELTMPSKGTIKVAHEVTVTDGPTPATSPSS